MNLSHIIRKVRQYGFRNSLRKGIYRFFHINECYSEIGEDIILKRYLPAEQGFYVDIGAYHPTRLSVTRYFYDKGWRGINIEPNPDAIRLFQSKRKRDINLNMGISDEKGELDFYYYGENSVNNTFDKERHLKADRKEVKILKISVDTLNNILQTHLPPGQTIDFLTIDVEGFELKILQSLDFEKYPPKLILVEDMTYVNQNIDFMGFVDSPLYTLLSSKSYIVVAKTLYNILFKKIG